MPGRTYKDFILVTDNINPDEWKSPSTKKSYTVRVFDSPAGQQIAGETVEIPNLEIPDYEQFLEKIWKLEARIFDGKLKDQRELGTSLASLLLPKREVRGFFYHSLEQLKRPSDGLRLWLRLKPQLADLPWEFIYLPHTEEYAGGFLALDPRISIVRHEELPIPADWPEPGETLRIVQARASPEPYGTYPKLLSLPAEQLSIDAVLHDIKGLEVVYLQKYTSTDYPGVIPSATLKGLEKALEKRTDILHFSGHGMFEARLGTESDAEEGKGSIFLAYTDNQACEVSDEDLASLVENKGVRLLSLAACDSGKRLPYMDGEGFTYKLLNAKIPCVLAMQLTIDDSIVAAFSAAFYQALVAGWTVDEAVSQGRAAMVASGREGKFATRDWGAPVLYSRIPGVDLFRPVLDKQAREEAERMAEQRARLSQAWWGWNGRDDTLATTGQLRNLVESTAKVELSPFQFLFLLRSHAQEWIPATPWLDRLRQGDQVARSWLERLDDPHDKLEDMPEAMPILGLDRSASVAYPEGVGRVAWSAVEHDKPLTRQTAALALVAISPQEGLRRILGALSALKDMSMHRLAGVQKWWQPLMRLWELARAPWHRWGHQSELYGALVELDPGQASYYGGSLPPAGRLGVWGWRMARQVRRQAVPILAFTVGGMLGAGIAVALERLLVGIFAYSSYLPASFFTLYSYFGFILGLGLSFGRALAYFARLGRDNLASKWLFDQYTARSISLSTLGFGLAFWLVSWVSALFKAPLPLGMLMGLVAGLSLSISMLGLPPSKPRNPLLTWVIRVVFGSLALLIPQWVDKLVPGRGAGTVLSMSRVFFESEYIQLKAGWWQAWIHSTPNWGEILNQLDVAFFGLCLAVGMALGWLLADFWLAWWRKVTNRSD
jgi:CHAT domain